MVNWAKVSALISALQAGRQEEARSLVSNCDSDTGVLYARDLNSSWVGSEDQKPTRPSEDDFYTFLTEDDLSGYSAGDIIKHREIGIKNLSNVDKAYQLVYCSENSLGVPVGALTTVIIPQNNDNEHAVTYPQAEDSSYINCASSYSLLTSEVSGLQDLLNQGWVVNVPDHEGFNSSFVAGVLEGKLTLDSMRAVEKSQNITGISNSKFVVGGYSGGSIATGWAAELYESYASELDIQGFAVGGFVTDPRRVMSNVNKTPYVGFVPPGIYGLISEYTALWEYFDSEIKPENQTSLLKTSQQCLLANLLQYAGQDIFSVFNSGEAFFNQTDVAEVLLNNTLGKTAPKPPLLIVNGINDQICPIDMVDDVVDYYCSEGTSLIYGRLPQEDHIGASSVMFPQVLQFAKMVFDGEAPSGCNFYGNSPDFASEYSSDDSFDVASFTNAAANGTSSATSGNSTAAGATASGEASGTEASGTEASGTETSGSEASGTEASGGSGSSQSSNSARASNSAASGSVSSNGDNGSAIISLSIAALISALGVATLL